MAIKRISVLGASGQLGKSFQHLSHHFPFEIEFYDRSQVDITQVADIENLSSDLIINCAAYTAVDLAEDESGEAYQINRDAVQNIAQHCKSRKIPLIHFSSDYVYHNSLRRPLKESDPTRPKGVYARSKLAGERKITAICDHYYIFRVSWLYGPFGTNFPKTMLRLAKTRDALSIVNDQIGAPTNTLDLAGMILQLCSNPGMLSADLSGIYNYCNRGTTSWDEIARCIFAQSTDKAIDVQSIPSKDYPTKAMRPRNSRLDLSKFDRTFGIEIRDWKSAMLDCLTFLKTN